MAQRERERDEDKLDLNDKAERQRRQLEEGTNHSFSERIFKEK